MTFRERVEEGLKGSYQGLENGLGKRINRYIFNVQRSCYTLIGGLSGSAKTTLVDFIILNALEDAIAKKVTINIFYYCFEINEEQKKAIWMSILIYKNYGIFIPPETIKGLGDNRLNKDQKKIVDAEQDNLDMLFSKIKWVFEPTNPTGIYKELWRHMETRGTFVKEPYTDEEGTKRERIVKFLLNDPNEYNIAVGDHIALCKFERGFDLKRNLDKLSEYSMTLRNLFGISFFWLQQFNQGLSSVERQKFKGVDISPQQSDFKDSTNPYADADVVIGLMNAHKMDMETCLGYNINVKDEKYNLKDRFRMLKVIKNRLSRDSIAVGLLFLPEAGSFEELPKPDEILRSQALMDKYNKLINER